MAQNGNINRLKFALDKRYLIFCFFLAVALILWLMTKLSSEYSVNLRFTPHITNSLTGGTYADIQNSDLFIQTKARGFYILKQHLSKTHVLSIDMKGVKTPADKKKGDIIKLPSINLKEKIGDVLGRDVNIISISPDTLYLKYSEPHSKKLPVVSRIAVSFRKEYMQIGSIQFSPDSITVSGQQEVLDTIHALYTVPASYTDVDKNIEAGISIVENSNLVMSQQKVRFTLAVERCTESTIKLPVNIVNEPTASSVLLLPPQVEVHYVVPLKDYASIRKESFYAIVDYAEADSSMSRKLKVKLLHKPQQVLSASVQPEYVEFIQHQKR